MRYTIRFKSKAYSDITQLKEKLYISIVLFPKA